MSYKRVLTIQDISCVGQCSLTVALPIISACGMETAILPSAVLSTHTGGFTGFTVRDLSDDLPAICDHWVKENIKFDAIYTGYLGSAKQIDYVRNIMNSTGKENLIKIVDPAMADNGNLYYGFDMEYVEAMKTLCFEADIIIPNVTEACFLTGMEYTQTINQEYIENLLSKLENFGAKTIVLTGVAYTEGKTGVAVRENGVTTIFEHEKIAKGSHGTGDVFASAFVGALLNDNNIYDSAKIAAEYTLQCIINTQGDESHWYGVKFETALPTLIKLLNK